MVTTSDTSYLDDDVAYGYTYTYTVRCLNESENRFTSSYNSKGWSYTYYLETTQIRGFATTDDGVRIKWDSVEGAEKYRVYYKGRNGWTRMATTTNTYYVDSDVNSGGTYTYTVRAINKSENRFTSDCDTQGWRYTFNLDTPKITSIKSYSDGLHIEWNPVAGASKYRVYYKTYNGWKRLLTTTSTSIVDSDVNLGGNYVYTVRCINKAENRFMSDFDSSGYSCTYLMSAPEITSFESTSSGVKITWSAKGQADKYRVYRNNNGEWSKISTTTATSIVDTNVEYGTTYTYTVRCLNSSESRFTSEYNSDGWSYT